jgi:hypothetical protein
MPLLISEFYSIVTPESAEQGDYDETGTMFTQQPFTFRELVDYIEREGFAYASQYPISEAHDTAQVWLENGGTHDYYDGSETYRTLHFDYTNAPHKARYWHLALKAAGIIKTTKGLNQ